ncbi:MAG: ABC transporter permease [Defluviitaleaceae bacterium]|nr:ABC transporter permease [Defluviitaleaceae bacterium]
MLALSIGKIIKNKGLFVCLFIACVFSVALIASIPAYENAINKRMLQREFRDRQIQDNRPPLMHTITYEGSVISQFGDGSISNINAFVYNELIPRFRLPTAEQRLTLTVQNAGVHHISPYDDISEVAARSSVVYSRGLFDHVELVAGRFPSNIDTYGAIEVVVSESAAARLFMLDSKYVLDFTRRYDTVNAANGWVELYIVGIVRELDPNDTFWRIRRLSASNIYTDYESFIKIFQVGNSSDFRAQWQTAFDHTALEPGGIQPILYVLQERGTGFLSNHPILRNAISREAELGPFLWVLQMPILALIVFFTIMLSGLILDHDKVEIALLYSRGASKSRVFFMYVIQTFLLAGVGMAIGIPLSLLLCRVIGAAAGFLEFAGRAPLDVTITGLVLRYAIFGALLFILSTLLPILFSQSGGVVTSRRLKAARGTKPFFEKYYLDFILIGISLYGYFSYQNLIYLLADTDIAASQHTVDPLIFLISTFFFMGFAMLFTRLYPYIIKGLFNAGRSFWSPAIYASLSVARSRPRSRYIMLFIIMTTAIGLNAAAAARTINQNHLDRAMYNIGADLIVLEQWSFVDPSTPVFDLETGLRIIPPIQYLLFMEPPFERFMEPDGVELATIVYRNDRATVRTLRRAEFVPGAGSALPANIPNVNVMAIYPDEFAQVAWWRSDMFSYHLNHKMNAMSLNPNVALLSRNLMDRLGVSHGDEVSVTWTNNPHEVTLYIYDTFDFFPAWSPVTDNSHPSYLIVMNYELVKTEFRLEPYEVWIRKEDGGSAANIIEHYIYNGISLQWVQDAGANLAAVRNDPLILSMNGFLTLSFVMTLAVTVASFLVFWIFELRSRRLQISIMRSMGMSRGGVTIMLLWEQVLLSILPLIVGFILGNIGQSLFVPMFEMGSSEGQLPFRVFSRAADSLNVAAIVSGSIIIAIVMLWYMAERINISQTLKLGEE